MTEREESMLCFLNRVSGKTDVPFTEMRVSMESSGLEWKKVGRSPVWGVSWWEITIGRQCKDADWVRKHTSVSQMGGPRWRYKFGTYLPWD